MPEEHARDLNVDIRRRRRRTTEILLARDHTATLPFSEPSCELEIQRISKNSAGYKTRYHAEHNANTVKTVTHRSASEEIAAAILAPM